MGKGTHVVSDQINSRDLLEHLVDVGEGHTMEFTVLAHLEQTFVSALVHFLDSFLDRDELVLDVWIIPGFLIETLENLQSLIGAALHDKPSWRLGQVENGAEDNYGKDNLES
jgi:hypothetical protein